jgi:hypothetical protein
LLYGYSFAFRRFVESAYLGRLRQSCFLAGVTMDSEAATFTDGVDHSGVRIYRLPDDVRLQSRRR